MYELNTGCAKVAVATHTYVSRKAMSAEEVQMFCEHGGQQFE